MTSLHGFNISQPFHNIEGYDSRMRIHNDYPVGTEGCLPVGDKGGLDIKFPYGYDVGVPGMAHLHDFWDTTVGLFPPKFRNTKLFGDVLPDTWKREMVYSNQLS